MKNNNIYLMALLFSFSMLYFSCDTNSTDFDLVEPVYSLESASASLIIDAAGITYDVVVTASNTYTADRSVEITAVGNGADYSFAGSVVIKAGELTETTSISFDYVAIPVDVERTIVLTLGSNPEEETTITYKKECTSNNDITLSFVFDYFSGETSWDITDDVANAIVASGGPYPVGGGEYSEDITLPDGDYTFTIYDSYGDGICCAFGFGSYSLKAPFCSITIASGGSFGFEESTQFSLP